MERRALIVAAAEGFIIKGIETKLKGIGVEPGFSTPKIRELKSKVDWANLIMIYTDDDISGNAEALVFIKDHCTEKHKQVIVIGTKNEYNVLIKYISGPILLEFYERPLDIESLISKVENYMDEDTQNSRRKSILIVDDDVSYMTMIMDWLKDTYRVSLANSGMQAITWLAKNEADLILLDYEMPITSGPQVLEMIQSDPATADIPVMGLTGKGDKESIMSVLALKPAGYLLKTVQKQELRDNISKFFVSQLAQS